jgi:hypothetical protein
MQTYFAPRYGFDIPNDQINKYVAKGAIDFGKIVAPDDNGVLAPANDYGYFLMQHVTADGPTMLEYAMNDFQYEVKADTVNGTPVSVLIPKKGAVPRTKHVAKGDGADPAVGQKVNISNGVYVTVASNAGTKGLIKNVYTDSLGNKMYDVEIL